MPTLSAIAMLFFVAAITPGPNNLVMLRTVSTAGLRAAVPVIAGVLLGGVAMITLGQWGIAALVDRLPNLRIGIVIVGSSYLAWLGYAMGWRRQKDASGMKGALTPPGSALGLFGFQFANPKSWALVLTAVSAFHANPADIHSEIVLLAMFALISAACLMAWAAAGRMLRHYLLIDSARQRFDRLMGATLLVSSVTLLVTH